MPVGSFLAQNGPALAGIGTSIVGGLLGSSAAQKAAKAQENAGRTAIGEVTNRANQSLDAYSNTYNSEKTNINPYLQAGTGALGDLSKSVLQGGMPNAQQIMSLDPGFDFRLQQGQQALERAQAAGGSIGSGGALKAAQRYGQDYASGEFSNAYGRYLQGNQQRYSQLMGIADLGQNANSQLLNAGSAYANGTANVNTQAGRENADLYTGIGNAQASGYIGAANAWSGALSGIGKAASGFNFGSSSTGGSGGARSGGSGGIYDSSGNYIGE